MPACSRKPLEVLPSLEIEPHKSFVGVLAAFSISERVVGEAKKRGLLCWVLDEEKLLALARSVGVRPDKMVKQPKSSRDPAKPTPVVKRKKPLSTSDPERIAAANALYERFPPSTMNADQHFDEFVEYWKVACQEAPLDHQRLAAELTYFCLSNAEGSILGRRTMGKSDSYSIVSAANGVTIAAIDARKNWVKLDFLLPGEVADSCKANGVLNIETSRRRGKWVQGNVPKKMSLDTAKELLDISIKFENEDL